MEQHDLVDTLDLASEPHNDQKNEMEQCQSTSQESQEHGWNKLKTALFTAGCSICLFVLSQILLMWIVYWCSGYGAITAAQNVLDLLQYLITPLGILISIREEVLYYLKALNPEPQPTLPDDRRQSVSRQPSFTYSEWTDAAADDFLDFDPLPETPVFDCPMDLKVETDPATLTVKPVGLQERRGSNVSLTLDMCTPGCTESYGSVMSPREQSAREYLQNASNVLTTEQLHDGALDSFALQAEFLEIPMNFVDPKEYDIPGLVRKNRYKTILPNPHSRVCLTSTDEDDPLSSYINANYIRGYGEEEKVYIATQGPTVNTVIDFWNMVWQQHSPVIVMITNIEEKNEKCTEYWPEETVTYEEMQIIVTQVIEEDDYILRLITLKCGDEERRLKHYWYTSWPDQKTPDHAPPLLQLVQEVEEARQHAEDKSAPVIVHCSAGLGRTGCFIATSIGCKQLKNEGVVDILRTTCQLRLDRGGMIQTCEQYQFVHHVLSLYERKLSQTVKE
ncbi:tyrosine-protein phosphatase non-receptor type 5 isoform X2 [Protopterus annectens]|uniref:tyrosine-protein phosphatase non-receptor type 5 isoform X2 n=1 Tax=Protopterus annectens TaxID=7888 RepID=UPI001CF9685F|nr:tyrosine-protein phosphatase non-receptor type 5 isoform X2 [Protopterus annectens]